MSHHKITRLTIKDGFLDTLDVSFSDGLNCIIGARGSGKTTILEMIRFALNRGPDRFGGDRRATKRFQDLISSNLDGGTVEVEFETQEGLVYRIERSAGDGGPTVWDQDGERADSSILESNFLIDAAVFSQNEVEEIAMHSGYLLDVLDRFCAKDLQQIQRDIEQARNALRRNASDIVDLSLKAEKSQKATDDLAGLKARLKKMKEKIGDAKLDKELEAASKEKELRTKEGAALSRVKPTLDEARRVLAPVQGDIIGEFKQVFIKSILDGPNGDLFNALRETMRERVAQFRHGIEEAEAALSGMEDALVEAARELEDRHRPRDANYKKLSESHREHQKLLREMHQLSKQVAQLTTVKEELDQIRKRLSKAHSDRNNLLGEYSALTEKRFRLREKIAKGLTDALGADIRVRVEQNAQIEEYIAFLTEHRDPSIRPYNPPIRRIAQAVPPGILSDLVDRGEPDELAKDANVDEKFAHGLLASIAASPSARFELEIVELEDLPAIELQVGNQWKPSDQLSTGQMCSVVLPLLLMEDTAPLLVDQPEDNLDNRFVSRTVVDQIRESKERRQMILITHNPNIPVLGMADRVIAMESDGSTGWVENAGDVESMRESIINLLEGGERAFQQRKERYGW